jgi:hypothetical protein
MINICIFCKNEIRSPSTEHLIPDSVIGKQTESLKIKSALCKSCNNTFGHTIDSEFLNHDLIKLIRLRNKNFIQKSKVPKFKTDNRIQVIDKDGYKIGFDAVADVTGTRYEPSRKPNNQKDNAVVFVRKQADLKKILRKFDPQKFDIIVEPLIQEPIKNQIINLSITNRLPPLNILHKMALEYIYFNWGIEYALSEDFDSYRIIPNKMLNNKWKMMLNIDLGKLVISKSKSELNFHEIGISRNDQFWFFYFTLFNDATFYCEIPDSDVLQNIIHRINLGGK